MWVTKKCDTGKAPPFAASRVKDILLSVSKGTVLFDTLFDKLKDRTTLSDSKNTAFRRFVSCFSRRIRRILRMERRGNIGSKEDRKLPKGASQGAGNHPGTIRRKTRRVSEDSIPMGDREQYARYQSSHGDR